MTFKCFHVLLYDTVCVCMWSTSYYMLCVVWDERVSVCVTAMLSIDRDRWDVWRHSSVVGALDDDDTDIAMSDAGRQVSLPAPQPQQPPRLVQIKARHVSQTRRHRAPFNLRDSADADRCDRRRWSRSWERWHCGDPRHATSARLLCRQCRRRRQRLRRLQCRRLIYLRRTAARRRRIWWQRKRIRHRRTPCYKSAAFHSHVCCCDKRSGADKTVAIVAIHKHLLHAVYLMVFSWTDIYDRW